MRSRVGRTGYGACALLLMQLTGAPAMAQTAPARAPLSAAGPHARDARAAAGAKDSPDLPDANDAPDSKDSPEARELAAQHPLTLDEALALGEKNNRDLLTARARLRGAHADVERALAALLPTVTAQGKFTYNYPEVTFDLGQILGASNAMPGAAMGAAAPAAASGAIALTPQTQLDGLIAANIPLVVPAAYPALAGARAGYRAQERRLEVTTAQLLQSVATAFFAAAGAEELVSARRHAIEVSQKTVDIARVRLAAGVINRVEVTRAELALLQARQRLLESQDTLAAAYRTLGTMLQLDAATLRVAPQPVSAPPPPAEPQLIADALQRRPEVAGQEESVRAAHAQVRSTALRWAPTLSGFGNIRLTNATGFAGRADYYSLGLQLDWLLFDGFARDAQRHTAEAQKREAELGLSQLRDTIADEVYNGRRTVLTRQKGLFTAQRAVQMAKATLELVRAQYESGTSTQLDLLTAQDQLIVAEVGLAQARFDQALAVINLRRLTGSPLGSELGAPALEPAP